MTKNRLLLTCLWLALLGLGVFWIKVNIKVNSDLGQFLPQATKDSQLLLKAIRNNPGTSILIISLSGSDTKTLAKLNKHYTNIIRYPDCVNALNSNYAQKIRKLHCIAQINKKSANKSQYLDGVSQVFNGDFTGDTRMIKNTKKFLLENHYLLDPTISSQTFSVDHFKKKLARILDQQDAVISIVDENLVMVDPLGSISNIFQYWKSEVSAKKKHGVWFSEDGKETFILLRTSGGGFEIDKQEALIVKLKKLFGQIPGNNSQLNFSGPGFFAVDIRKKIQKDVTRLSVLAMILVGLFLLLVYRAITPLTYGMLPLASGIVAGISAVLFIFGSIHSITIAFGITLIGVTVDYPIHLFTHIKQRGSAEDAIRDIWPTLRLGILTTAIGFTAMLLAGFEGLKQLAIFAIMGLIMAAITTRWFLPYVVNKRYFYKPFLPLEKLSISLVTLAQKLRVFIILLTIAAVVLIFSRPSIMDHDIKRLTPISSEKIQNDRRLRNLIGASNTRFLLTVTASDIETVLKTSEALVQPLKKLSKDGVISGFDMAARYLPSKKLQSQRQASIPQAATLRARFAAATSGTPFNLQSFEPFFTNVMRAKTMALLSYKKIMQSPDSPISIKLKVLLQSDQSGWLALIPLQGVRDHQGIVDWLAGSSLAGVRLMDIRTESSSALASYANEALLWLAWGTLIILLILLVGLRSIPKVLRVIIPICISLVLTIGVWTAVGVKLNIFHLVSLLLVVGVGIDYALFFNRQSNQKDHTLDYVAIWVSNITTVIVFGLLYTAYPLVLQAIGGTVAMGAFFAYIASASIAVKNN